jgi:shikimate dehydrogenase
MGKRYAVFGHPVSHSLSPRIHAAFARQAGIELEYVAIDAPDFAAALAAFEGDGANVTLRHTAAAAAACATLGEPARRCGVVNTLTRRDGGWHGDNTDGVGLVRDLTGRHRLDLRGRRTLLLGAGGGARGVAPALLDAGVADLFIANRTPSRADALADMLGAPGRVHPRYFEDLGALGEFDLVVNATSATRGSPGAGTAAPSDAPGGAAFPPLPMSLAGRRTAAVDLSYGEAAVGFLAWARAAGVRDAIDGLGMLVEQAAESFRIWHGVTPDTDPAYEALRERDAVLVSAD